MEEYEEYEVLKDLVSSSQSIPLFVYDKAALAELQVAMLGVAERCGTAAVNNIRQQLSLESEILGRLYSRNT